MPTFKLTVAYDGTDFAGWQLQPGQRTVQGEMQRALGQLAGRSVVAIASGRTDAGVHALGQVVSCEADIALQPEAICRALNALTPRDITILDVQHAADRFHAIRDAIRKRYRYLLDDGPFPDVFLRRFAWHCRASLDHDAMREAARHLLGRHDFAAFQASGSPRESTIRTVYALEIARGSRGEGQGRAPLIVEIEADGFLYNMVRNIVGTLLEVARGKQPPEWVEQVRNSADRKQAAMTAPAEGLYLVHVDYASDTIKKSEEHDNTG